MTDFTTIKLPVDLRDLVRDGAAQHGCTQAEYINRAIREFEQAEFLRAAAAQRPDHQYEADFAEWDNSQLVSVLS